MTFRHFLTHLGLRNGLLYGELNSASSQLTHFVTTAELLLVDLLPSIQDMSQHVESSHFLHHYLNQSMLADWPRHDDGDNDQDTSPPPARFQDGTEMPLGLTRRLHHWEYGFIQLVHLGLLRQDTIDNRGDYGYHVNHFYNTCCRYVEALPPHGKFQFREQLASLQRVCDVFKSSSAASNVAEYEKMLSKLQKSVSDIDSTLKNINIQKVRDKV